MEQQHSFVVPAYGESPYLKDCLSRLTRQTVGGEVIMTTSTPSSFLEWIAGEFNIPYYINPGPERGIAADWNFALSKASGPLVTIAHQDDLYDLRYRERILASAGKYGADDLLMLFTGYEDLVNGSVRKQSRNALVKQLLLWPYFFTKVLKSRFMKRSILLFGDPVCCPAVTLNQRTIGDFSFSSQYSCVLDWFAWYELAQKKGAFIYVPDKLVQHRIHAGSETTAQLNSGRRREEEREMFERIWGKFPAALLTRLYSLGHKDNL